MLGLFIGDIKMKNKTEALLICNKMKTPDGTILESHFVHEAVYHTDKNGKKYMTDGGLDYIHRIANGDEVDLSVYSTDSHDKIRENLTWGTYGKSGRAKFKWILLKNMETSHIEAVLENQKNIYPQIIKAMKDELKFRSNK